MKGPDGYTPLPATVLVLVKAAAPVQVALAGPNALKVMVPVGLKPPDRVAESEIGPPTVTGPAAVVTMAGVARVTVVLSPWAPHALTTGLLLMSPL